jgi:hypothetical protein
MLIHSVNNCCLFEWNLKNYCAMLALVYFYKNNKAYNRFHFCSYFIIFQFKTQNHNLS